mmetsp:Transcript_24723/g.72370  ORF Transcript_24723/g.72370 Transcript_24723/m.72370 type:complete len:210 (+) Transcript_24723:957-1586(+)
MPGRYSATAAPPRARRDNFPSIRIPPPIADRVSDTTRRIGGGIPCRPRCRRLSRSTLRRPWRRRVWIGARPERRRWGRPISKCRGRRVGIRPVGEWTRVSPTRGVSSPGTTKSTEPLRRCPCHPSSPWRRFDSIATPGGPYPSISPPSRSSFSSSSSPHLLPSGEPRRGQCPINSPPTSERRPSPSSPPQHSRRDVPGWPRPIRVRPRR